MAEPEAEAEAEAEPEPEPGAVGRDERSAASAGVCNIFECAGPGPCLAPYGKFLLGVGRILTGTEAGAVVGANDAADPFPRS